MFFDGASRTDPKAGLYGGGVYLTTKSRPSLGIIIDETLF